MNEIHDLFIKYGKDIYRFALYLCGDKTEAEEITAETFSRVILGKSPLVSVSIKGYLFTIVRNLHLDKVRLRNRFTNLHHKYLDSVFDLEHYITQKTELEDVLEYLQTFAEIDRTALLLKADGVSYDEISKLLDISLSSAKVKVHRLRIKLFEWRTNREMKKNKTEGEPNEICST
jgi:RNA polymerase sigma-70 factor (ECF subfamily)